jgi:hypothetical protein
MRLFPKSSVEWSNCFIFVCRAYVLLAFLSGRLLEEFWPSRHGGGPPDFMQIIILGYIVCFFFFIVGWLSDWNRKLAFQHFIFAIITFFIGLYSVRYLVST